MVRRTGQKNQNYYKLEVKDLSNDEKFLAFSMRDVCEKTGLSYQCVRHLVNLEENKYKYNKKNYERLYEIKKLVNKIYIEK